MPYKPKRTLPRKRRRGLRRHWRNHQQWAAAPQALSLRLMESVHSNTEQLGLAPWTVHGKPPRAIRQLWASRLLADFFDWQRQLTALYSDFWLSIRLYDHRFGLAQLDAATHEQQAYFERRFSGKGVDVPLPPEYQSLPGAAQLRWTCYPEVDVLEPAEFAEHVAWYKRKPHWTDQDATGKDCVLVQTGYVWVGRAAT
ncbi:hypothetical protein [Hymenobacter sp. BT559]|uniref:hypothetical protein n=1 Tax=Hymenobacter sp. BT559 TaxID=2795729 RepID=UPI0018ECBDD1|nr:hypothetical protein [Hymenobacter sp. BT559]MBJ6145420.1 hypothetical protein [Hymenobacter sp. BT559]